MKLWRIEYGANRPIPEDVAPGTGLREGDGKPLRHTHFSRLEEAWAALLAHAEAEREIRLADLRKAEDDLVRAEREIERSRKLAGALRRSLRRCSVMEKRAGDVLDEVRRAHQAWLEHERRELSQRAV